MPKGNDGSLGRAIIKNRAATIRSKKQEIREKKKVEKEQAGLLPETGLTSILDIDTLDDFLDTVALSQRNFETEKGSAIIVDRDVKQVIEEEDPELAKKYRSMQIPRRPKWDNERSPQEQDRVERDSFLEWRRNVAKQIESDSGAIAPFEKNLEVWRQLWRVTEKSDVLVQIVDCRNPLLFRCSDLEVYANEIHPCKRCILILNKSDLIPDHVRIEWGRYLESVGIAFVFFSAKAASAIIEKEQEKEKEEEDMVEDKVEEASVERRNAFDAFMEDSEEEEEEDDEANETEETEEEEEEEEEEEGEEITEKPRDEAAAMVEQRKVEDKEKEEALMSNLQATEEEQTRYRIHTREEVMCYLEEQAAAAYREIRLFDEAAGAEVIERKPAVGMIGFPNVGKSSFINVLLGVSASSHGSVRVAVGATPGKTKHLQTVVVNANLMLCDCPGLVFPVFMNTKADLIFNGVLPVSNMREHIEPIRLVCHRVDRHELERVYHISLPRSPLDPPNCVPHPRQLLHEVCTIRGYMASYHSGVNEPKGAIVILKDVLSGALQWWISPPSLGLMPDCPIDQPAMEEGVDPTQLSREALEEITEERETNGGRHHPRQRNKKERSSKKVHKGKAASDGSGVQFRSKGAYAYKLN